MAARERIAPVLQHREGRVPTHRPTRPHLPASSSPGEARGSRGIAWNCLRLMRLQILQQDGLEDAVSRPLGGKHALHQIHSFHRPLPKVALLFRGQCLGHLSPPLGIQFRNATDCQMRLKWAILAHASAGQKSGVQRLLQVFQGQANLPPIRPRECADGSDWENIPSPPRGPRAADFPGRRRAKRIQFRGCAPWQSPQENSTSDGFVRAGSSEPRAPGVPAPHPQQPLAGRRECGPAGRGR